MSTKRKGLSVHYDTVILIDMQTLFVPKLRRGAKDILIHNQIEVLRRCIRHDIPVAVLEFIDNGPTIDSLVLELARVGRKKTLLKDEDDGFSNPQLHKTLQDWRSKKLLLMGINAEYCVRSTAESAIKNDYQIITSPGLISGQDHHDPGDCLWWYSKNGTLVEV